jgi:hypothetical protein
MLKFLTLFAALWAFCWMTAFVADARPMDWVAGPMDAHQTFLALLVSLGILGSTLYGIWAGINESFNAHH